MPVVVHTVQLLSEVSPEHTWHFGSHFLIKIINYLTPKNIVELDELVEISKLNTVFKVEIVYVLLICKNHYGFESPQAWYLYALVLDEIKVVIP